MYLINLKLLVGTTGGQASKDFTDVTSKSKDTKSIQFDLIDNKFLGIDLNQNEYDNLLKNYLLIQNLINQIFM